MLLFDELVFQIREICAATVPIDPAKLRRGESGRPMSNATLESILEEIDNAISQVPIEVHVQGR